MKTSATMRTKPKLLAEGFSVGLLLWNALNDQTTLDIFYLLYNLIFLPFLKLII